MDISPYLKLAVDSDASDIFFTVGSAVRIKVEGRIKTVGKLVLTNAMTRAIAHTIMTDPQRIMFEKQLELDFAITMPGSMERFRANAFYQKGSISVIMRYIRASVPTLETLNLPQVLGNFVMRKRGLVLMAGSTNSGKSTTLAAMLDYRNTHKADHIITIEDPIEFVHDHKKSLINQRELGLDTHSYANALRSCMRESPDVIQIGEIRDLETMEAALALCNTGHLTLSTMHANNAYQTIQRIVNMYPHERHRELLMDLSMNLIGIVSQRLVEHAGKKHRVAAIEVMVNTPHIADLILRGEIDDIKEAMQNSGVDGMLTFDQALLQLFKAGSITLEEALNHADSRTDLQARINFG